MFPHSPYCRSVSVLLLKSLYAVPSHENQATIIEALNSTSRYLDDVLNIGNEYFEQTVDTIFPKEHQLNKIDISDTEAPFLDLNLSILNDNIISSKIYDKRDDFDFDIANFPILEGDVFLVNSFY